jgi:hypothetical protein
MTGLIGEEALYSDHVICRVTKNAAAKLPPVLGVAAISRKKDSTRMHHITSARIAASKLFALGETLKKGASP